MRLALEAAPGYAAAGAFWRGERRLRARAGGRVGLREHIPDAEVHWPDGAPAGFAGECWAIEAELTRKTVAQDGRHHARDPHQDRGLRVPGRGGTGAGAPPRHARVVYLCSPAARPTVARARAALAGAAGRVEIRALPPARGHGRAARAAAGGPGPVIRRYLGLVLLLAVLRAAARLARVALAAVLVVAAAPVSLVAALR